MADGALCSSPDYTTRRVPTLARTITLLYRFPSMVEKDQEHEHAAE